MSSSQFAQASAAPVSMAPPIDTKQPTFAFWAACQLPELDAIAQVVAEMLGPTDMQTTRHPYSHATSTMHEHRSRGRPERHVWIMSRLGGQNVDSWSTTTGWSCVALPVPLALRAPRRADRQG